MRNIIYYSQKNNSVSVNGIPMQDFDEGEAITWEYITPEKVSVTEGLDATRMSVASGTGGKVTIKLKPTSPSVTYLLTLYRAQQAGLVVPLVVTIRTGVNDTQTLINAGINCQGGGTGDAKMSGRTFEFVGTALVENP